MDEEMQKQKAYEEPGLVNSFDQTCGFTSYIPCSHADMAWVVVDLENMNTFRVNDEVLGLSKKLEAHKVEGQSGARPGGSRSGTKLLDYGPKSDEGNCSDGNDGSQGGSSVKSLQEERNGMKKRSNSGNTGMMSGMVKKSLAHTVLKNCEKPCEDVEDAVGPVMMCEGGALSPNPIEGEASVGKFSRTYQRRPKLKGLMELGAPNSHPRRSARLHAKISQAGSSILFRQGMSSASLSDGDIENCNQRLFVSDPVVEPSKL